MHTIVRNIFCLLVFVTVGWAQESGTPDGTALLAKGKQLYVQEGPNPALKQFEQALAISARIMTGTMKPSLLGI